MELLVFPMAQDQISVFACKSSEEEPKSIFYHKREHWGQIYSH